MSWPENDFLHSALCIWILVTCLWSISVIKKNASIIDPFWSITITVGGVASVTRYSLTPAKLLFLALVLTWALRLWGYLFRRGWGEEEDPRYQAFRKNYGADRYWWFSYFQVFLLQGVLAFVVSLPIQFVVRSTSSTNPTWVDYLGAAVFLIGFIWEAVGDYQLEVFKKNPDNRGKLLDTGLWGLSRHPNYFGEALLWWGLWICVIDEPSGLYAVVSPLLVNFLLVKVSGVSMLEARLVETKPGFKEYMERTPAFIPRLRK